MLHNRSPRLLALAVPLVALAAPAATAPPRLADVGGTVAPAAPRIAEVRCDEDRKACPRGTLVSVRGEGLETVETALFLGRAGAADDHPVTVREASRHRALVRVPAQARSGPVRVLSEQTGVSAPSDRVRVAPPPAPPAAFPIAGTVDWGTEINRFGGGRGHDGQDLFADCGTAVRAARGGKVVEAETGGAEGNYAVIESEDGGQQAYLHLLEPATVTAGDAVAAGRRIGAVGQTGNAQGCHLHFELWTAPGRFTGGQALDPYATLRRWSR